MAESPRQPAPTAQPSPPAPTAQELFSRLAQTAGLALALLYGAGALDLMGDLWRSGISVTDVFPIIPIEQHLARSIGLLVSPRGLVLMSLLAATALVLEALSQRGGGGQAEPRRILAWLSHRPRPALVLLAAAYLGLLVIRPLLVAQQLISLLALYGVVRLRPGGHLGVSARLLAIGFAVLFGFVLRAYVVPRPLPSAEVTVEGAPPIRGLFIAVVANSWYLAESQRVLRVAGEKHVITARVVSRAPRHDWKESTLPALLGLTR